MTSSRSVLFRAVAVALFAATPALAQTDAAPPPPANAHHAWHHPMLEILRGVTLTPDQKTQIHQLIHSNRGALHSEFTQLRSLHQQYRQALLSGASQDQLNALQQQQDTIHTQLERMDSALEIQVRSLLTPQQIAQAQAASTRHWTPQTAE
jgi:Spy/CpxP family protein refolding chaperone